MNRFFEAIKKTSDDLAKGVQNSWDDVKVHCPSQACRAVLQVPPGAQVFQCSACGTQVYAPTTAGQLTHHLNKFANSVVDVVDEARGQSVPIAVVVPEGAAGGQTIAVPASIQGSFQVNAFQVAIPGGLVPGQSFVAQVPVTAAKRLTVTSVTSAPETVPVAQPVDQQPGSSASPAAEPVAPSPPLAAPAEAQPAADAIASSSSSASAGESTGIVRTMTDTLSEATEAAAATTTRTVTNTWNDVKVRCPSCQTILAVPNGAQVFACGVCNVHINCLADTNRVGHHIERAFGNLGHSIDVAINRKVTVQATVPEGKGPGDVLQVMASMSKGRGLCEVVVPEGVAPGQTFTAQVKAAEFKRLPCSSIATAAPQEMPVAEIVWPSVQRPGAQPVAQPAAPPAQLVAASLGEKAHDGTIHSGPAASSADGSVVVGIPVEESPSQGATNATGLAAPEA